MFYFYFEKGYLVSAKNVAGEVRTDAYSKYFKYKTGSGILDGPGQEVVVERIKIVKTVLVNYMKKREDSNPFTVFNRDNNQSGHIRPSISIRMWRNSRRLQQ
jgi:hypothetical protein